MYKAECVHRSSRFAILVKNARCFKREIYFSKPRINGWNWLKRRFAALRLPPQAVYPKHKPKLDTKETTKVNEKKDKSKTSLRQTAYPCAPERESAQKPQTGRSCLHRSSHRSIAEQA